MKVSRAWLQMYFDKEIPSMEKLDELFSAHTFEVEDIEKVGDDDVFDAKILPDRAHYMLSHRGVAEDLSVLTGFELSSKTIPEVTPQPLADLNIKIETELCNRYVGRRIDNVIVGDSPDWLKTLLGAVGQKSINSFVDAGNFVMLDCGQPLHIFDADKVEGDIVVRMAKPEEKIVLLTGETVVLTPDDMVIADDKGPLAIAGVKGGKRAEVTKDTKNIIIEAAHFNPTTVRRTSTKYDLRNDSSKRFENEITPELAGEAMERISSLLLELSPDAKPGEVVDVYPNPVTKWTVQINVSDIAKGLGVNVEKDFVVDVLQKMKCEVEVSGDSLAIIPPFERLDMMIPADIVDEIGRIIGYDGMESVQTPEISDPVQPDKTFFCAEKAKNILIERGYSETILYSLVNKGDFEIVKPLARDKKALRKNLSVKMEEALIMNGRNKDLLALDTIKLCEIGKIFTNEGEKTQLAIGVLLGKKKKGVTSESILREDVETFLTEMSVKADVNITTGEYGAIALIDFDSLILDLPQPTEIASLNFAELPEDTKYEPFSPYPFMSRDIAVFVDEAVSANDVLDTIVSKAGDLCIKQYLFDEYHKDEKVSYAYRLIFQSFEKTLTDEEVNVIMDEVNKGVENKGWEVR